MSESDNKKFRIQNGVDVTGELSVNNVTVIGADGKVVPGAIADAVTGITSAEIAALEVKVDNILGSSPQTLDTLQEIVSAFETADSDVQLLITSNSTAITVNSAAISAEVDRATVAEATLSARIDQLETDVELEDASLDQKITNEVSRAVAAETTLQSNIDALGLLTDSDYTAVSGSLIQEIAERQAGDLILDGKITNEEASRISGDATLQAQITSNDDHIQVLENTINTQAQARVDGDAALDVRMTTAESEIDTLQSEMDAVESKNASQDLVLDAHEASINHEATQSNLRDSALGDRIDSLIDGTTEWTGDIIPDLDNVHSLGSPTKMWKDVYVGPGSLYINGQKVIEDNSGTITVNADPGQNLSLNTSGGGAIDLNSGDESVQIRSDLVLSSTKTISTTGGAATKFGGDVDLQGNTVGNVASPVDAADAATKEYVDSIIAVPHSGVKTFSDDVVVQGTLTVQGTTTTINSETLSVADNMVDLNSNMTSGTPTENAGIRIMRGDEDAKSFVWNEATDQWTVDGWLYADRFVGDGSGLTGVTSYTDSDTTALVDSAYVQARQSMSVNHATTAGDADKLDGQHGAYYQPASTAITTGNIGSQTVSHASTADNATQAGDATLFDGKTLSYVMNFDNLSNKPSNVDNADKLDGEHGAFYLDYSNFTSTPTIPTDNAQLGNGAGYITASQVVPNIPSEYFKVSTSPNTLPSGNSTKLAAGTSPDGYEFIQSHGGEPLHINPVGNKIFLGGITGGEGPGAANVNRTMAITSVAGASYLLMGNQDSVGANRPAVLASANGTLYLGYGDTWTSSNGSSSSPTYVLETSAAGTKINTDLTMQGGNILMGAADQQGILWSRNTDAASIKFYNTSDADTNSRLEFNISDNGNEDFTWVMTSGGTVTELARMSPDGGVNGFSYYGNTVVTAGNIDNYVTNSFIQPAPGQQINIPTSAGGVRGTLATYETVPHFRISTSGNESIGFFDSTTENIRINGSGDLEVYNGSVAVSASQSFRFNGVGDTSHSAGYDSTIDGSYLRGQNGIRFLTGTGSGSEVMRLDNTGMTMTGDVTIDNGVNSTLSVKCDNAGTAIIRAGGDSQGTGVIEVTQDGSYGGGMSYNGDNTPAWAAGESADHITFYRLDAGNRHEVFSYPYSSGEVTFNQTPAVAGHGYVWHAGNDGPGSGLDADTVDGLQASAFFRKDTSNEVSGHLTSFRNTGTFTNSPTRTVEVVAASGNDAMMSFHVENDYAFHFGLDHATNDLAYGGWSLGSGNKYRIWTEKNLPSPLHKVGGGAYYRPDNWIDFGNNNEIGLYWGSGPAAGFHVYPQDKDYLTVRSGQNSHAGIVLKCNDDISRGYFYADGSNNVGILTSDANWAFQIDNNKQAYFTGEVQIAGNQVYHTGNIGGASVTYATNAGSATAIDNLGFFNTSTSQVSLDSTENGIGYWADSSANFTGNAVDGALYNQHYNSNWQHQILGDYRSGMIAVRGRNDGSWQSVKPVPTITLDASPAAGWNSPGEMWWDTTSGRLKIAVGTSSSDIQWVDASPSGNVETKFDKAGGVITGPVTMMSQLDVRGTMLAADINASGTVTQASDESLKDDVQVIENAVEKVGQMRGVTYVRNDMEDDSRHAGVIAQEVESVLPEVVSESDGIKSVAYGNMVGLLIEAVKEQQATIDALTKRVEELEGE